MNIADMVRATGASRNTLKDNFRSLVEKGLSPCMEEARAPGMHCPEKLCGKAKLGQS